MNKVKWLHLSDLHFNFSNEICIDARDRLLEYINKEQFDFIIISGDCAYKNGNYEGVIDYLKGFKDLLKDNCKNNVFITLGNHDIKRKITRRTNLIDGFYDAANRQNVIDSKLYTKENPDEGTLEILLEAVEDKYIQFYHQVTGDTYIKHEACNITKIDNENIPVNIINLNTCLFSYEKDNEDDRKEKLLLDTRGIKKVLKKNDSLSKKFNIMIGHHALDCFCEEHKEKFKQIFSDYKIDMYLCGHTHISNNTIFTNDSNVFSQICVGCLMDDGSDITVATGELSFETGKGYIIHHIWDSGISKWRIHNGVSRMLDDNKWNFTVKKFIVNPLISKVKDPLISEIKSRYGEASDYVTKINQYRAAILSIYQHDVKGREKCGKECTNRCQESEENFSKLFRTTINQGIHASFFSNEDILVLTIGIHSLNVYKYYLQKNTSALRAEIGKIINACTEDTEVTQKCMDILSACFDETKFNRIPLEVKIKDGRVVHPKLVAVALRILDKISSKPCLICDDIVKERTYLSDLKSYTIKYDENSRTIVINYTIDEQKAFTLMFDENNLYGCIINEVQKINDERLFFNSYYGHLCLIESIQLEINFIAPIIYGYDGVIHTIKNSISSLKYKAEDQNFKAACHNMFMQVYPEFEEKDVMEKIRKAKEAGN
jgi:predicted MPP superfamily phosphohydrolase